MVQRQDGNLDSTELAWCRIPAGDFHMGSLGGEADELPVHRVWLSEDFWMTRTPVTNAQFERFDPDHRRFRGKDGFSAGDDEAVVFVTYREALVYCAWLSAQEGDPCRLPTEAEWEYACRAGTTTAYATGDTFPEAFHAAWDDSRDAAPRDLTVGRGYTNSWGLQDMHGLVEEWCLDWFGPYAAGEQTDPGGPREGDCRVTRGGNANSPVVCLRSANRLGALPEVPSCLTGFRVVRSAVVPRLVPVPVQPARWQREVDPAPAQWTAVDEPFFREPLVFVNPPGDGGVLYPHNHAPSLCWCPNGDLLAAWFSTQRECGREMVILASRLRHGTEAWDAADLFYKVPDRNMSTVALLAYGDGRLYHFNGVGLGGTEENLVLVCRVSTDCGVTWSPTRPISTEYASHKPMGAPKVMPDGSIIQPCDVYVKHGPGRGMGSVLYRSDPAGHSFRETTRYGQRAEEFLQPGGRAGWIAGVHGQAVPLMDGRILAFGRSRCILGDQNIAGHMPQSVSADGGATWEYSASPFPPIGGCQRHCILRLAEGPLVLFSFTDSSAVFPNVQGMAMADGTVGYGLFAAVSWDEGGTWPLRKLVTTGGEPRWCDPGASAPKFLMDATHAQPVGYLQAIQTPDRTIHLISSRLHYRFNLPWLQVGPGVVA